MHRANPAILTILSLFLSGACGLLTRVPTSSDPDSLVELLKRRSSLPGQVPTRVPTTKATLTERMANPVQNRHPRIARNRLDTPPPYRFVPAHAGRQSVIRTRSARLLFCTFLL